MRGLSQLGGSGRLGDDTRLAGMGNTRLAGIGVRIRRVAGQRLGASGRTLAHVGRTIRLGWNRLSIRSRLLASVLILVAIGLVVSDVAAATALRSYLVGRVDAGLANAGEPAERLLASGGLFQAGAGQQVYGILGDADSYVALVSSSGQMEQSKRIAPSNQSPPSPPALPTSIGSGTSVPVTLRARDSRSAPWRVIAVPISGENATLVIGASLAPIRSTMSRLELIEVLVSLGVLALIGIVGRWLVHLGLRPLDLIGDTAGAFATGDLSQRIERQDTNTEVGRLGLALNTMMGQIEASFVARQASEERLRRFVADASHELRTPLTSIRGYAELFRRGAWERPDDLRTAMRRIEEESIRMGGLVEDMLLLARLDQHRPLESIEVDLAVVATDAVTDARAAEPDRPIALDAPAPVLLKGDQARLRQVVANLLANVRDHTPSGTAVLVSARVEGAPDVPGPDTRPLAVLEVADSGPGLDPEAATRVFERFYRVDTSRSRASLGTGAGSGLGLSIVAAIAEAHGGWVGVRSLPGQGSVFRVELPASAP
ncbi:MAG: ATP-binding protein [Acidimicrobiales bacterium]